MVLEHVAQHADAVVKRGPVTDSHRLGDGDLDMIDVVAVPDRLEDAVGEAEDEQVLHGFLAQIVIDAIDLVLLQDLVGDLVEVARGFQILTEGFLDDHATPPIGHLGHAGLAQAAESRLIDERRCRQIIETVAAIPILGFDLGQPRLELAHARILFEITADIAEALSK